MKIIEKSPAVFDYICEICNNKYDKEVAALSCEKSHIQVKGFVSKEYHTEDSKYPEIINVRMDDGSVQMYKSNQYKAEGKFEDITDDAGIAWFNAVTGLKFTVSTFDKPIKGASVYIEKYDGDMNMDGNQDAKLVVHIPENVELTEEEVTNLKVSLIAYDINNETLYSYEDIRGTHLNELDCFVELRVENMSTVV